MAGGFRLTTTASKMPVYRHELSTADDVVHPNLVQSSPLINLDAFRADPRFAGINGSGFSSVIIDSGIDLNHPFFGPDSDSDGIADRIVFQYDFSGSNDNDASDFDGHGSNVASIVASQDATYNGMAPATDIIALKVFPDSGNATFGDVEEALQWVVANATAYNIASVNMSLGDVSNHNTTTSLYGLGDELAALNALDVIVVSAAGNDYFQFQTQGVSYPAADPNSLAVGAVWDANNGGPIIWSDGARDFTTGADRITSFSQRSTTMTSVFAPGAFITGANQSGGTVSYAGTSQAAPHIAGIATLAQQLAEQVLGRRLSMSEFESLLGTTGVTIFDGDDEDDNVTNTQQSYRRVDVLALGEAIWAMGIEGVDLLGTQLSVAPDNLLGAGGQTTASFTVRNIGDTDAAPFDVKFYLSDDAIIDPATDILLSLHPSDPNYDALEPANYHVVGGLNSFSNHSATIALSVPINDPFSTDGQYYVGMFVDAEGEIAEADESNNRNRGDGLDRQTVFYSASFSNAVNINIPNSGVASPYPSNISVSGMPGTVADVNVSLFGLEHARPDDIDILLVGPAGQKMILLSDVGGTNGIPGVDLVLDDEAANFLPDSGQLTSGTFKPTNIGTGDTFASPAPAGPYGSLLSDFDGTNPNGTWRLYVVDDGNPRNGSISGGWGLTFVLANIANTPPTNPTNVLLPAIDEDTAALSNPGHLISSIVSASGSTDADGNPLGIAVTSVDNAHGQWQYSTNGGGSWQDILAASLASARLLGPAHYVRFMPNADFNSQIASSPAFGFKVWDQTVGAAGGTADTTTGTAFSAAAAQATQPVTAINDPPSFALASTLVDDDEDAGAVLVSDFATDIRPGPATATDEAGQALVFLVTVIGTTGTLSFGVAPAIDPVTGDLSFAATADSYGTATIEVVLQDNGSSTPPNVNQSAAQQFSIEIAAVNDEQVLATNAGLTVQQGSVATITSAMLETTDVDNSPAELLYTINTGPSHGTILVDGTPDTQFSQQQINAGAVSYQNDGTANSTDSFDFAVDDGQGTASTGTFNIIIRPYPGDYNRDLVVDAADYVLWRKTLGTTGVPAFSGADGDGDGDDRSGRLRRVAGTILAKRCRRRARGVELVKLRAS